MTESQELCGIGMASKGPDRAKVPLFVVAKIQSAAIGPEMAGHHILTDQGHVILNAVAKRREQVVKDVSHRQHRWARVNWARIRRNRPDLAARMRVPFQQRHLIPRRTQAHRTGKPGDAGADDQRAGRLRCRCDLHVPIVDSPRQCVQYDLHLCVSTV